MNDIGEIDSYFNENTRISRLIDPNQVIRFLDGLRDLRHNDKTLWTAGNGGSASAASHLATDFNKTILTLGGQSLRTIPLNDFTPLITATANDLNYEESFSFPLSLLAHKDDGFLVFSVSGTSPNIIKGLNQAKNLGCRTFVVFGENGRQSSCEFDFSIIVPSNDYQIVENLHIVIMHLLTKQLAIR